MDYCLFENEIIENNDCLEEQNSYRKFIISRQKKSFNSYYFTIKEFNNSIMLYANIPFRTKNKKVYIYSKDTNDCLGFLLFQNKIISFYLNQSTIPSFVMKFKKQSNSPASCSLLFDHPDHNKFEIYKKSSFNKLLILKEMIINKKPLKKYNSDTFFLKFKQRHVISSRKNIILICPYDYNEEVLLELGKLDKNQFTIISKKKFSPLNTFAFAISWLSFL